MEFLSISALDLFASALGIFVLMAILLFPYYLRQPSLETELEGAQAGLAAAGASLQEAERVARTQALRQAQAGAALAQAREQLQAAEALAAAAEKQQDEAAASQDQQATRRTTPLSISDLDLVFVMDTTGSMRNELADVQANLLGVIRVLHRLAPSLRVGFVAFKDRGAAYVTRSFPLSAMTDANVAQVVRFVGGMSAEGGGDDPEPVDEALAVATAMPRRDDPQGQRNRGGDDPEPVDEALAVATAMPWRDDAQGQIIVIGDAPARSSGRQRALQLAERFRSSAPGRALPRTVSTIYTGPPAGARIFFEQIAQAGGGDSSAYQGQIIEDVLLSVLHGPGGRATP